MASVRVEGFPSPDAKTNMEAMVNDESEKTSADLSEDKRQDREIAFGAKQLVVKDKMTSQELVGEIQLAVEEPKEVLRVKDMPAREESTPVEREKHELTDHAVYRRRCRERKSAADYGCMLEKSSEEETAVPAVCCDNGFLNEEYQQEDDGRKKLVVTGKKNLSYEVGLLSLEATVDSTWFMTGFTRVLDGSV